MNNKKKTADYKIIGVSGRNRYRFYCDLSGALCVETASYKDADSEKELMVAWEREGKDNFLREILYMCPNKAVGKFLEAEEQFCRKVMTENADLYYNGIINLRLGEITIGQWRNAIKTSKLLGDRLAKKLRAKRVNQE